MEYYSAMRMSFTTTWINLERILLSEIYSNLISESNLMNVLNQCLMFNYCCFSVHGP